MTYEFTIYVQYLVKIRKIILYAHFDTVLIGIHEQWWNGQHLALFDHWMVDTQAQQPANKKFWFKVTFFQENEMGCHIYKEVVLAVLNCVKPMRWLISLSKLCTVQLRPLPYWTSIADSSFYITKYHCKKTNFFLIFLTFTIN